MDVSEDALPDDELGPLIARGRDAQVFALGADRVVRRTSGGGDLVAEAHLMEHVRQAGYPVPRLWRVAPGEMVMERVAGPTMGELLARRPWQARRMGDQLAELHAALHQIPAPPDVPAHPVDGQVVLHLDLHPLNVILSRDGPVVIDWTNARRGPAAADVADVWIVLDAMGRDPSSATTWRGRIEAAVVDRIEPGVRQRLLDAFLDHAGRDEAAALLASAAELRLSDRNLRPSERHAIQRLVAETR